MIKPIMATSIGIEAKRFCLADVLNPQTLRHAARYPHAINQSPALPILGTLYGELAISPEGTERQSRLTHALFLLSAVLPLIYGDSSSQWAIDRLKKQPGFPTKKDVTQYGLVIATMDITEWVSVLSGDQKIKDALDRKLAAATTSSPNGHPLEPSSTPETVKVA